MIERFAQWFQVLEPVSMVALGMLGALCLIVAVISLTRPVRQRIGQWINQWFQDKPSRFALWIGVLFLLGSFAMLVNPVRLVLYGKNAVGVVTNVAKREGYDQEKRATTEISTFTISFKAGNQNEVVHRSSTKKQNSVCVAGCESYSKGDRLKILYLADDPDIYEVDSFAELFGPSLLLGMGGAFCLFLWVRLKSSERDATISKEFNLKAGF